MGKEVYLVPFSGGLDSTYLIYKLLEEGNCVYAFHVSFKHKAENKWAGELDAVEKLSYWFSSFYDNFSIKYVHMDISSVGLGFDTDQVLLIAQKMCYFLASKKDIKKITLAHGIVPDDINDFIKNRMSFKGVGINNLLWNSLIDSMTFKAKYDNINKINRII